MPPSPDVKRDQSADAESATVISSEGLEPLVHRKVSCKAIGILPDSDPNLSTIKPVQSVRTFPCAFHDNLHGGDNIRCPWHKLAVAQGLPGTAREKRPGRLASCPKQGSAWPQHII